jgi:hypothetical protein
VGSILDMAAVSCDVEGASCEESFLLCLFTVPVEPNHFLSSVATPRGYKADGRSRTISHRLPASFPMAGKKER